MKRERAIKQRILDIVSNSLSSLQFLKYLMNSSNVLVFGGAVREVYSSLPNAIPRDLDLVLVGYRGNLHDDLVSLGYKVTENKFDGIKIKIDDINFDLWKIEDTWAFKKGYVKYNRIEDLYKTVYLNIDGIFYNLNTEILYSDGYDEAIKTKELDIVLEQNPQVMLNIMRAFKLKKEYNLSFSKNLESIIGFIEAEMGEETFHDTIEKLCYNRYKRNVITM